ncbi:dipeptidyl aminopeptidase [Massilia eurypsychrophila]|uniref:Dipeptidyl aminopeptidase n=1 Tax=Massilia eurypsychrophila TaxID=1485217 RepID=A0A2G8TJW3_9BURK|nr:alpha/beta fold hydrolase [Massilia eurypsychrophila]PIL46341.1 dipeptidyl aminopeptidase [Massilia eurypsychrophila]
MPSRRRRVSWAMALLLAVIGAAHGAHAAEPAAPLPAIESFFENPAFTAALLAPDARHLAVRIGGAGKRDLLAVVDLETRAVKAVASFDDVDVGDFEWVNNDRLILNTIDKRLGVGERQFAPGLYAVNRDGAQFRQLASRSGEPSARGSLVRALLPWHTYLVRQKGAQDSEFVYVTSQLPQERGQVARVDLLRLNTLNGRTTAVQGPANTRRWMLDHTGEPRLAATLDARTESIWYRDPATDQWRKLAQFDLYQRGPDAFAPLAFGPDGSLYVTTEGATDKRAVHRFDFAANRVAPQPLVTVRDFDFSGSLVTTRDKLLGVRVLTDADGVEWFDAEMKAVQQRVDALLPGTVNLLSVAARAATPWVLVQSYADIQPRFSTLFNTATGKLVQVGGTYTKIDPAAMGRQELVRYKARDGLEIPAWLTLPNGSSGKNLPLVVLVHGGPYVRGGQWGWHPQAQFLASRGYAVLEPEYRGSTGYGFRHYRAGWKQWGRAMQDDIADGATWAIAEGIVDPRRICIAGASYGGYAALMGLINDPALYKCGINWVGVTDIKLLATGHWSFTSDMSDTYKQYGMPELVGDLVADAAQLTATSPLAQAARIKQPLLLAYGAADRRVPLYHGTQFYEAVKRTNADVEWVVYADEGHGWTVPKNRIDFWSRVEKFLDKNIGSGRQVE